MAWDEELFQRIGEGYDLVFAGEIRRTEEQTDFAMRALGLRPGQRLLDLCCGPGRHCLALARRGLMVTGVDRDPALLALGRQRARAAGLGVQWVAADARHMPRIGPFHGAICMFASWGYAAESAQNLRVLSGVAERLVPGARFLLDVPNLSWLNEHPSGSTLSVVGGTAVRETRRFHADNRELHIHWRVRRGHDAPWEMEARYRVHGVDELEWLMAQAGLVLEAAYGDFDGSVLTSGSPRCILLTRRPVLPVVSTNPRG